MKFKIPFTISSDIEILKRGSKKFLKFTSSKLSKMDDYLKDTRQDINRRQYLAICYKYFLIDLLLFSVIATTLFGYFKAPFFYFYGLGTAFLISGFIFINQVSYPRAYSANKARNVEKNLISVLQDMLVQLNSGIPLFSIISNISNSDYGEVSEEFKRIAKEISAGTPQIEAIEEHGKITNSKYLKRVLWQISNGMRAGSDMSFVIREEIDSLSEEQAIQVQRYGGKLNPLIMFYMLIAVILPSLMITFFIIISSILNLPGKMINLVFFLAFGGVVFLQIMFLGLIKSRRPTLL